MDRLHIPCHSRLYFLYKEEKVWFLIHFIMFVLKSQSSCSFHVCQVKEYLRKEFERHGYPPNDTLHENMAEDIFAKEDENKDGFISSREFTYKHDELWSPMKRWFVFRGGNPCQRLFEVIFVCFSFTEALSLCCVTLCVVKFSCRLFFNFVICLWKSFLGPQLDIFTSQNICVKTVMKYQVNVFCSFFINVNKFWAN